MIKKIYDKDKLLGIVIKDVNPTDKVTFYTDDDALLQLGYMKHAKGTITNAHWHKVMERTIPLTQEIIYMIRGYMRLDFYTEEEKYVESVNMKPTDVAILVSGGHGTKMYEDSDYWEVKQGPYLAVDDKVKFHEVADDEVIINE